MSFGDPLPRALRGHGSSKDCEASIFLGLRCVTDRVAGSAHYFAGGGGKRRQPGSHLQLIHARCRSAMGVKTTASTKDVHSPSPAHGIFSGGRYRPHRRCRGFSCRRRATGPGHHRHREPLWRRQVLQGRARQGRQAHPGRGGGAARAGGRSGHRFARAAAGAERAGLPEPLRAAGARLDAGRDQGASGGRVGLAGRAGQRPDPVVRRCCGACRAVSPGWR